MAAAAVSSRRGGSFLPSVELSGGPTLVFVIDGAISVAGTAAAVEEAILPGDAAVGCTPATCPGGADVGTTPDVTGGATVGRRAGGSLVTSGLDLAASVCFAEAGLPWGAPIAAPAEVGLGVALTTVGFLASAARSLLADAAAAAESSCSCCRRMIFSCARCTRASRSRLRLPSSALRCCSRRLTSS